MRCALAVAVLVLSAAVGQELPEATRQIKTLTVEQC
jgi:hypothetical protein